MGFSIFTSLPIFTLTLDEMKKLHPLTYCMLKGKGGMEKGERDVLFVPVGRVG